MRPVRSAIALAALALALLASDARAAEPDPVIASALERLYNFDFDGAHAILDRRIAAQPDDPLGRAFRGATYLFSELDRLDILVTEFFRDDKNLHADKDAKPDPEVRARLMRALERARALAGDRLAAEPDDLDALFALTLAEGVYTDYLGLVEKRGIKSFGAARAANRHAQRLLELEPEYYDAYLGAGVNEYLLGSLPFFIRWMVPMKGIEGDKEIAVRRLRLVAERGTYLGPFARILLSVMALREKRPGHALELLEDLAREYPENPLFRREAAQLKTRLAEGELTAN